MTGFDYPTWAAQGRANADKLPDGVAEALGPERDWADELQTRWINNTDKTFADMVRAHCRPIGNDTVTDEACLDAAITNFWNDWWSSRCEPTDSFKERCRKHFAGLTFPEATP